jgi:group I intron endonuclease
MNQGIYKIRNLLNDHFYIGSAVNLKRRKSRHFSELRNKKHNNKRLQAAWDKYGEEAFIFEIVELVENLSDLYKTEDKWLCGHVGTSYCYNLGMAAISPMLGLCGEKSPTWGYKHTDEAKAKISEAGKGRVVSEETRAKRSAALKGREIPLEQRIRTSKTLSGEGKYWYGKKRPEHGVKVSRPVMAIDPAGNVATYPSITAMRQALGLTPTTVNRAVKDGVPLTRGKNAGWAFKYIDPRSAVVA